MNKIKEILGLGYRQAFASCISSGIYTIGFLIYKYIFGLSDHYYFEQTPWIIITLLTYYDFLNELLLFMFFYPTSFFIEYMLYHDKSKNKYLNGLHEPVTEEISYKVSNFNGKVPFDLNGVYLRNDNRYIIGITILNKLILGPNPMILPSSNRYHWFDGDGMIHGIKLQKGEAFFCNRAVKTDRLENELNAKETLIFRLGEFHGVYGLLKYFILKLKQKTEYIKQIDNLKDGSANTSIIYCFFQVYALVENAFPFKIKVVHQKNEFDIKSEGFHDFDGQLKHMVGAHPKYDYRNKLLHIIGYDLSSSKKEWLHYSEIDQNQQIKKHFVIPIRGPIMVHDFAMTQNFIIFNDLPFQFNPSNVAKGKNVFQFNKCMTSNYGIISKNSKNVKDIIWFELPPHYVFHYSNAWECNQQNIITMYGCSYENIIFDDITYYNDQEKRPHFTKFQFDLTSKKYTIRNLTQEICEFPVINQEYLSIQQRYCYLAFNDNEEYDNSQQNNNLFKGILKYDLEKEKIEAKIYFGKNLTGGEMIFQKKPSSKYEDDGYIMGFVTDITNEQSYFRIWSAKNMNSQYLYSTPLRQKVPIGFHGIFIPEEFK